MRNPALAVLVACGLLTGGALSGCDGGSSAPPTGENPGVTTDAGPPDAKGPCDLLTQQEAADAAGNPVKEGERLGVVCIWEPEDDEDDANLQLSVGLVPIPSGADAAQICEDGLPGIPNAKPFPGIGNQAYWDFTPGGRSNAGSLHVCLDQAMVDTGANGGRPEAELQQIAVSLAETVIGRL